MNRLAWVLLLFLSPLQAFAVCEAPLLGVATERQKFEYLTGELRKGGYTRLLEDFDKGKVEVHFRQKLTRFQSDVSWKTTIGDRKKLIVRSLPWSSPAERQLSLWKVARSLYQLQLEKRLLGARHKLLEEAGKTIAWEDSDELLTHFFAELPLEARRERRARIAELDAEMKRLAAALTAAKAEELKNKGNLKRYRNWVVRNLVASLVVAALQTPLSTWGEIPSLIEGGEALQTQSLELNEVDRSALELNRRYDEHQIRRRVVAERDRLSEEIRELERNSAADAGELAEYRRELERLYDRYPFLRCIPVGQLAASDHCQIPR